MVRPLRLRVHGPILMNIAVGPEKRSRLVVATTDPATLLNLTNWYLATNLRSPSSERTEKSESEAANLDEG
jgi:hypothetical protein